MKPGDIGILQHLQQETHFNGTPAEIIKILQAGHVYMDLSIGSLMELTETCYGVLTIDGQKMIINLHMIRPLNDPDEFEVDEEQAEITA